MLLALIVTLVVLGGIAVVAVIGCLVEKSAQRHERDRDV
jgi:hypothetical protein